MGVWGLGVLGSRVQGWGLEFRVLGLYYKKAIPLLDSLEARQFHKPCRPAIVAFVSFGLCPDLQTFPRSF